VSLQAIIFTGIENENQKATSKHQTSNTKKSNSNNKLAYYNQTQTNTREKRKICSGRYGCRLAVSAA